MPLRSKLLTQRWSTLDLPILPFLAPRVFTQWPSYARRTHRGPRAERNLHGKTGNLATDVEPKSVVTPRRIETTKGILNEKRFGSAWDLSNPQRHVAKTSSEEDVPPAEMEFLRKYQEIWTPRPVPQKFPKPSPEPPPADNEHSSLNVPEAATNHDILGEGEIRPEDPKPGEEDGSHSLAGNQILNPQNVDAHANKEATPTTESHLALEENIPAPETRQSELESSWRAHGEGNKPIHLEGAKQCLNELSWEMSQTHEQPLESDVSAETARNESVGPVSPVTISKYDWPRNRYKHNWGLSLKHDIGTSPRQRLVPLPRKSSLANKRLFKPSRLLELQRFQILTKRLNAQIHKNSQRIASMKQTQRLAEYHEEVKRRHRSLQSHLLRQVELLGVDRGRTKFLRLPRISEDWIGEFSPVWNTSFAMLDLQNDKYLNGKSTDTKIIESTSPSLQRLSNWFLKQCPNLPAAERFWQSQNHSLRLAVWPELMIHALTAHPFKALRFLVATYSKPYPPNYAVSDSIEYILRKHFRRQKQESSAVTRSIYRWILRLLSRGPEERKDYLNLTQDSIYMLLTNLHPSHLKTFYKTLEEHRQPLQRNTLMHFAAAFGKSGQVNMAMDVLRRMKAERLDFRGPQMASICATILQREHRLEEGELAASDLALFEFMLECGMEPNVVHYNILMRNTFEAGHHELGWQIFNSMKAHGIEPHAHTYSILMNDAKKRNDRATIHQVWSDVQAKGIRNVHIITDLLHSMLLFDLEKRPTGIKNIPGKDTTFGIMLSLYCMYFRLGPLAHVAPVYMDAWPDLPRPNQPNPEDSSVHSNVATPIEAPPSVPMVSEMHLLEPDHATLTVMMTALVRDLPKPPQDQRPYESRPYATRPYTLRFYEHFHKLVSVGDPIAVHLVRESEDRVYNLAIMGLGRAHGTLHFCTEVIGSMLSHNQEVSHEKRSPTAEQYERTPLMFKSASISSTQTLIKPPKPTIRTWSILLKCFLDRNQPRAAEKVLQMMVSRGMKPDLITWQSLVVGYSRMQDIDKAVDSVDRMEYAGFRPDEITTRSLRWLRDRQAVVKAFSKTEKSRRWAEKFDPKLIAARKDLELDGKIMEPLKDILDKAGPGWDIFAKEEEYPLDDIVVTDQYKNKELPFKITRRRAAKELMPPNLASEDQDKNQHMPSFKVKRITTVSYDNFVDRWSPRKCHYCGEEGHLSASCDKREDVKEVLKRVEQVSLVRRIPVALDDKVIKPPTCEADSEEAPLSTNNKKREDAKKAPQREDQVAPVRRIPVTFNDKIIKPNPHRHKSKKCGQARNKMAPLVGKESPDDNIENGIVIRRNVSKLVHRTKIKKRTPAGKCVHPPVGWRKPVQWSKLSFKRIKLEGESSVIASDGNVLDTQREPANMPSSSMSS